MAYLNKTVVLKEINCSKIKIKKHSGNFESTGFKLLKIEMNIQNYSNQTLTVKILSYNKSLSFSGVKKIYFEI